MATKAPARPGKASEKKVTARPAKASGKKAAAPRSAKGAAKKALARRPVRMTLTLENAATPGTFTLQSNSPAAPVKDSKHGPKLVFNNNAGGKHYDGFEVEFTLVDATGGGYLFHQEPDNPSPNDAMSVKLIDEKGYCPRRGSTWSGFAPTQISADRLVLTVDNPNEYPQLFGFAFHLSKLGDRNPRLTYDPIGENQNSENLR